MAAGSPDLVDCVRSAEDAATIERAYPLADFVRLRDVLAAPAGELRATIRFERLAEGRAGATLDIEAVPRLLCQRCLQPFDHPVRGSSRVEFTASEDADAVDADREAVATRDGRVSLQDLAEEELLLALPIAPLCADEAACARRVRRGEAEGGVAARSVSRKSAADAAAREEPAAATRRPFAGLKDLIEKSRQ